MLALHPLQHPLSSPPLFALAPPPLSYHLHLILALGPSPLRPPHPLLSLTARSKDVPHSLLLHRL